MEQDLLVGSTDDGSSKDPERLGDSSVSRMRPGKALQNCPIVPLPWQQLVGRLFFLTFVHAVHDELYVRLSNVELCSWRSGEIATRKGFD